MTRVDLTSSNIRSNPLQRTAPVTARIVRAASFPGFNIGQEIATGKKTRAVRRAGRQPYSDIWHDQMLRHGKSSVGLNTEIPISFPIADWDRISDHQREVHAGKKRVSPNRYIDVLDAVHTADQVQVAVIGCHPVSKGYMGARNRTTQWAWRSHMLHLYFDALGEEVSQALQRGNKAVTFGGDMNHPAPPAVRGGQLQLIHSGLDHLWVATAPGWKVANIHTQTVRRNAAMDHPILHASFDLRRI